MSDRMSNEAPHMPIVLELADNTLSSAEMELILKVLEITDWNLNHSAELLRIPRQSLERKLKKHRIFYA